MIKIEILIKKVYNKVNNKKNPIYMDSFLLKFYRMSAIETWLYELYRTIVEFTISLFQGAIKARKWG